MHVDPAKRIVRPIHHHSERVVAPATPIVIHRPLMPLCIYVHWWWNMTTTSEQTVVVCLKVPAMERKLLKQRQRLHFN